MSKSITVLDRTATESATTGRSISGTLGLTATCRGLRPPEEAAAAAVDAPTGPLALFAGWPTEAGFLASLGGASSPSLPVPFCAFLAAFLAAFFSALAELGSDS